MGLEDLMNDPNAIDSGIQKYICEKLQNAFDEQLLAIYFFGSRANGVATQDSDLDIAILVKGYVKAITLWDLANEIANKIKCEVDLLDLRAASTVMQHQIITTGYAIWKLDLTSDLFELFILNEKLNLDDARAMLINDIQTKGSVYGE